jgi:hypothetical protein
MIRNDQGALPGSVLAYLDPIRVQEYLRATGWQLESRLGKGKVAVYERPELPIEQSPVPLHSELPDFTQVMNTAVAAIAQHEKRPASEVLTELLFPPSDVLRFAEQSPSSASGSVPFEHGVSLLEGARKSLLAATCTAIRPARFHPRMSLGDAEIFLSKCRLGQTERGSFVLTVACPLDVAISSTLYRKQFTRHVTGSLMGSLQFLEHNLKRGNTEALLNETPAENNSPIISSNLCEGLLEMAPREDDAFLSITASYSRELQDPGPTPNPPSEVRLTSNMFAYIEKLAADLKPTVAAAKPRAFVGFVDTLDGRPNEEKRIEGKIVLRLITEDESIRARAELDADNYAIADRAHMGALPVSIVGNLHGSPRSYRIENISSFKLTQSA